MSLKDIAKMIHKASKQKDPAEEFSYMLGEAIKQLSNDNSEYQAGVYRPSSLGGCLRSQYYQAEGARQDDVTEVDPQMVGMAESGTDRHERLQNVIQKMEGLGMAVEWIDPNDWAKNRAPKGTIVVRQEGNEVRFRNTILNLHFKCDGIIKFLGHYYILEIKTEVSFKFRGRISPDPKHIKQASAYSLGLGISNILFIYENRDVLLKKAFVYKITEEQHGEVIHEIETIETYRTLKKIPPMSTIKRDCTYCNFKMLCKTEGRTEEI